MTRERHPDARPAKERSRSGCRPCRIKKVKCDETKPLCSRCQEYDLACDYTVPLKWHNPSQTGESHMETPATMARKLKKQKLRLAGCEEGSGAATPEPRLPGPIRQQPLPLPSPAAGLAHEQWERNTVRLSMDRKPFQISHDGTSPPGLPTPTTAMPKAVLHAGLSSPLFPVFPAEQTQPAGGSSGYTTFSPPTSSSDRHGSTPHVSPPPGPPVFEGQGTTETSHGSLENSTVFYGLDWGVADMDLHHNDDENAIQDPSAVRHPPAAMRGLAVDDRPGASEEYRPGLSALGDRRPHNYYHREVRVEISKALHPLPPLLLKNKMNLLYFHHFINYTATVLVPFDDPRVNPFSRILPRMAVKNKNLLSLVLAYSAAHRARHLRYAEPKGRLLREKGHLNLARSLVLIAASQGGLQEADTDADTATASSKLMWSWFAYLDVLGSLSSVGGHAACERCIMDYKSPDQFFGLVPDVARPATTLAPPGEEDGGRRHRAGPAAWDHIDPVTGFTTRCIFILAKIALLTRKCDEERIDPATQHVRPDWRPDADTWARADALDTEIAKSLVTPVVLPTLSGPSGTNLMPTDPRDHAEVFALNKAFHWAALVHLRRRAMGIGSHQGAVKLAVSNIVECLGKIEQGSAAEACLLFPMFTAGCELTDARERRLILDRMLSVERTGMMHVSGARRLMEKVWETGKPWEALKSDEFIG
ncbi:hypothetical protein P8C59_004208 [Phyllachora maydis]|uniref:Zn(2)-C6 fungal-type domain-containing protein n=1 Tax=Phyllachora maydis TaxID=1825666 RepID=A0AAD9I1X2_9PEZI|nr:hypothetical protein P8C59_004208 [Phyllachora maydis]